MHSRLGISTLQGSFESRTNIGAAAAGHALPVRLSAERTAFGSPARRALISVQLQLRRGQTTQLSSGLRVSRQVPSFFGRTDGGGTNFAASENGPLPVDFARDEEAVG